jgi:probable HAF family extracellular repeat protein
MNTRHIWLSASTVFGLLGITGSGEIASAQPIRYSITDLGALPASSVCNCFFAAGISENGAVTGYYFGTAGERRGFVWQNGVIRDVGGVSGTDHVALAVNDSGVSVGFGDALAFRSLNGVVTDLPSMGGPYGVARAINNAGVIAGQITLPQSRGGNSHASIWNGMAVTDIGTLGGEMSEALAINEAGRVVGWAWDSHRNQLAFTWAAASGMVELPRPSPQAQITRAQDVNALGHAVGGSMIPFGPNQQFTFRAYLWTGGGGGAPLDLGELNPDNLGVSAHAINDADQVLGFESHYPFDHDRPFIWEKGVMRDINSLIDPASGWRIDVADDINNAGMIAASGTHVDGRRHGLLLTPIPPCVADFNEDGFVGSPDFFDFLAAFFAGNSRADVDNNGQINSADFFFFLGAFFQGC